jgi:TorA maturation chaperone TorD
MNDVNLWLERAACWRFGSLLFQEPAAARTAELQALVPVLPAARRVDAAALAGEQGVRSERYYSVLGPGGCPAAESAYDRAAMANRGPLIAEVSAFYDAFAYPPRLTTDLVPDHVAVELDFLGFLALKIAFALHEGRGEDREIAETAFFEFQKNHPGYWMDALRDRLSADGDDTFARAAGWVCQVIAEAETAAHA